MIRNKYQLRFYYGCPTFFEQFSFSQVVSVIKLTLNHLRQFNIFIFFSGDQVIQAIQFSTGTSEPCSENKTRCAAQTRECYTEV